MNIPNCLFVRNLVGDYFVYEQGSCVSKTVYDRLFKVVVYTNRSEYDTIQKLKTGYANLFIFLFKKKLKFKNFTTFLRIYYSFK
jgi:hypothetical protein